MVPKGIEFAAGGAAFGAAAGGSIASIYLYIKYVKEKRSMGVKKIRTNPAILTQILKMAIPISIGATVGSIMNLIDAILVPQKLIESGVADATALYGQLTGKAAVLVNVPLTLSMALGTSLIPIIAENYILNRKRELESKTNLAMKLSAVIAFPCTVGLFCLAGPVMKFLFFKAYDGYEILKYLSLSIPFVIITQTTTSILQGTNHYIRPVINLLIGCLVKVILTMVLVPIPQINIFGAVIASISAYVVVTILNIISLKKKINTRLKAYDSFIKPLMASLIMGIMVSLSYSFLLGHTNNNSISCLLSIFVGIIIYIIAILVLKVFKIEEIKNRIVRK